MSRDNMLGEIRAVLRSRRDEVREREVGRRLNSPSRHQLPARATRPASQLAAQFASGLKDQSTAVIETGSIEDIPVSVAAFLSQTGVALRLRMGDDPCLAGLAWDFAAGLVRLQGPADPSDIAALSHAVAGVAETGTLVLASGPDNPTSLAFMPEIHLVAVARGSIVGSYEEAFDIVRARFGHRTMPRALNFVSGASRTGDIGGRIVMGAHGPRTLCVIIYGDDAGKA